MTTKLEAINTMLSCIGQAPLNSLEGTKSYFTVAAENILNDETKRVQLTGYEFNTDDCYELKPDENNTIKIPSDILSVSFPHPYKTKLVIRNNKLYDKERKSFTFTKPVRAKVVFCFDFEELPEPAKLYIKMSAAYKFVKRELGSQSAQIFTQEDLQQAYAALNANELEVGNYTLIPEMYNGFIKKGL